jgi:hypothetical protein
MSELQSRLKSSQPYVDFSLVKQVAFMAESFIGNIFYRRPPPPPSARPYLLNMGCGSKKYPGWVNADFYNFHDFFGNRDFVPDWMLDLTKPIRCPDGYWDGIFTEHTMEHLTYEACFRAFSEMHRILAPGAWIRVIVPDLSKYVSYYRGESTGEQFDKLLQGPGAISNLTQAWGHKSIWDGKLLCETLRDNGFVNVQETAFGQGNDPRLIKDSPSRAWESCYVEGQRAPL